jgi:hypothetical protein
MSISEQNSILSEYKTRIRPWQDLKLLAIQQNSSEPEILKYFLMSIDEHITTIRHNILTERGLS